MFSKNNQKSVQSRVNFKHVSILFSEFYHNKIIKSCHKFNVRHKCCITRIRHRCACFYLLFVDRLYDKFIIFVFWWWWATSFDHKFKIQMTINKKWKFHYRKCLNQTLMAFIKSRKIENKIHSDNKWNVKFVCMRGKSKLSVNSICFTYVSPEFE